MILGGSNSGPKTGWAAELEKIAPEHQIENKFLGAVGSLFGLLRLFKQRRDRGRKPDVVIFEYTLNDSLWLFGQNVTLPLIEDTLHDVATFCAREGIGLLFLCLCLRPPEPDGEAELSLIMDQFYRKIALERGATEPLLQSEILGGVRQSQYVDSAHIGPEPSLKVAQAVAARLREPVPVPRGARRGLSFFYLDAARAEIEGPGRRVEHDVRVFKGPFVELARGGRCLWRAPGRLVALMVRSTQRSGNYRIQQGDVAILKNAQSLARENVPDLMILHYVTRELPDAPEITVEMPSSEAELMALPYDLTLMDGPALTPFEEQRLELNGIMAYRPRSRWRRAIDRVLAR